MTEEALRLLEQALVLRMHGEKAPGGAETWSTWEERVEVFLRSTYNDPGGSTSST